MKSLVTGASGFIGSRLAAALLERGDQVRGLVHNPGLAKDLSDRGVELVAIFLGAPQLRFDYRRRALLVLR